MGRISQLRHCSLPVLIGTPTVHTIHIHCTGKLVASAYNIVNGQRVTACYVFQNIWKTVVIIVRICIVTNTIVICI